MRSEIFAQIKKNRKQYYSELRNDKKNNIHTEEQCCQPLPNNLGGKKQIKEKENHGFSKAVGNHYYRPGKNLGVKEFLQIKALPTNSGIFRSLKKRVHDVASKLPGSIERTSQAAENTIHNFFKPAHRMLSDQYRKLSFMIDGRMELVANYAIDNINHFGTVIFDVEEEQTKQSKNQVREWNIKETENFNIPGWFSGVVFSLPLKLRKAVANLLIYLESDVFIFKLDKNRKTDRNEKTIFFKPLEDKIKTIKMFSFLKNRADSENSLQDVLIQNTSHSNQNTGFYSISKYFRKQLDRHLFPLINKFL